MKKNNPCSVLDLLRKTYSTLLARCRAKWPRECGEYTLFDLVHDTVIKVLNDPKAQQMTDEKEFADYFMWRVNTTIYQVTHDKKTRQKNYADYKTFKRQQQESSEEA